MLAIPTLKKRDEESSPTNRSTAPLKVVETESGFIICDPAPGAAPPTGPNRLSRALNSDQK